MTPGSAAPAADIAVVGAGIVGLSCAFHLQRRGHSVLLVDAKGPGAETSFGNAGSISVGNVMPQSVPGIVGKALRMLVDPLAPLKLDWPRLPRTAGWLLDFVRAGRRDRVAEIASALHAINAASRASWLDLADAVDARDLVAETGYLRVYSERASFAESAWERELMREHGARFQVLDHAVLRELEPGLGDAFELGLFQPDALALRDPGALCTRLHARLLARGVRSLTARVDALARDGGAYRLSTTAGDVHAAGVLLAAGAWTPRLSSSFGIDVPVLPARGYHLMFAPQPGVVRRPTLWAERYMVVSPMAGGIRMTSIKEITTVDGTPRPARIRRLEPEARRLFPSLVGEVCSHWSGLRPCTPDSLPIVDRIGDERVWIATGHGHLGLTQAPVTGEMVAALVDNAAPPIPLAPYRLSRFPAAGAAQARPFPPLGAKRRS